MPTCCWTVITNNASFPCGLIRLGYSILTPAQFLVMRSRLMGVSHWSIPMGKRRSCHGAHIRLDMVVPGPGQRISLRAQWSSPGGYRAIRSKVMKITMVQIQDLRGTPGTSWGIAGY